MEVKHKEGQTIFTRPVLFPVYLGRVPGFLSLSQTYEWQASILTDILAQQARKNEDAHRVHSSYYILTSTNRFPATGRTPAGWPMWRVTPSYDRLRCLLSLIQVRKVSMKKVVVQSYEVPCLIWRRRCVARCVSDVRTSDSVARGA